ncbi:MAG: putative esterase [Acidimicrobiales bacterium]|jgi:predicted esterase
MSLVTYRLERDAADRLLFLFHGYSAEQHHLAAYVPLVDPDERFSAICPRAIHDLPDGDGASWFGIDENGFDKDSFHDAAATLRAFVDAEAEAAGVPLERCVIGGFSQGGYLALALAGQPGAAKYAGVWAMCCALPPFADTPFDLTGGEGRAALVQFGTGDPFVSNADSNAAASALRDGGWNVRTEGYDMAHSQTLEMMVDAREWLTTVDS